jgi:hypothetical protein
MIQRLVQDSRWVDIGGLPLDRRRLFDLGPADWLTRSHVEIMSKRTHEFAGLHASEPTVLPSAVARSAERIC